MSAIEVDERTAAVLRQLAKSRGLTVEALLKAWTEEIVLKNETIQHRLENEADPFDAELDELVTDGVSLPPDFSRADVYLEHD